MPAYFVFSFFQDKCFLWVVIFFLFQKCPSGLSCVEKNGRPTCVKRKYTHTHTHTHTHTQHNTTHTHTHTHTHTTQHNTTLHNTHTHKHFAQLRTGFSSRVPVLKRGTALSCPQPVPVLSRHYGECVPRCVRPTSAVRATRSAAATDVATPAGVPS